jgi:hypothetical protein
MFNPKSSEMKGGFEELIAVQMFKPAIKNVPNHEKVNLFVSSLKDNLPGSLG